MQFIVFIRYAQMVKYFISLTNKFGYIVCSRLSSTLNTLIFGLFVTIHCWYRTKKQAEIGIRKTAFNYFFVCFFLIYVYCIKKVFLVKSKKVALNTKTDSWLFEIK